MGPEIGVPEMGLVLLGDLMLVSEQSKYLQTEILAEHYRRNEQAAVESEAARTLFTRKNIIHSTKIARHDPCLHCTDASLRYHPQHRLGDVKKIHLIIISRDPTILVKAEHTTVMEGHQPNSSWSSSGLPP